MTLPSNVVGFNTSKAAPWFSAVATSDTPSVFSVTVAPLLPLTVAKSTLVTLLDDTLLAAALDAGVDDAAVGVEDAGVEDAGVEDAGVEDAATDAGVEDAATDAGVDDAATEAGVELAATDAGVELAMRSLMPPPPPPQAVRDAAITIINGIFLSILKLLR